VIPFFSWVQRLLKVTIIKTDLLEEENGSSIGSWGDGWCRQAVVQQMVERSYQVRALVRDTDKAQEILG